MKNKKGITLISLIIYIIGLLMAIGTLSMFMKYYYSNVNTDIYSNNSSEQYTNLTMYISNDISSNKIKAITSNNSDVERYVYFKFEDETIHEYIYKDRAIFYLEVIGEKIEKNIMICSNVDECNFVYTEDSDELKISIKINDDNYSNMYYIKTK